MPNHGIEMCVNCQRLLVIFILVGTVVLLSIAKCIAESDGWYAIQESRFYGHQNLDLADNITAPRCLVQTTLRVVENLGGRVFSTTGSFSTIGSAQN